MRVVVLTDDGPGAPGGVGTWVAAVARGLREHGHRVTVYGRSGSPDVRVDGPSFGRHGGTWLGLRALREVARADRVIAATWPAATFACRLGVDLAVVAHGSDVTRPTRDPRGRARVFGLATRRFAVSRFLADPLGAEVLPAPVDPVPPHPVERGVWAFLGRAVATKGGDRFVRWVAAAGVRGVLVGSGPERPRWEALARALGADVRFAEGGWGAVGPCELLVVPSRTYPDGSGAEGLGLVALEAAARGIPVVATACGGLPEAVGPAGLVVPDADDPPLNEIRGWSPRNGRDWLAGTHGAARAVRALLAQNWK